MNMDYCVSWLPFDTSVTFDVYGNNWTAYGNPVLSPTNAIHGNALQLDGSTYLLSDRIKFGGGRFRIEGWVYVDSSSPDNSRVFAIYNAETNIILVQLRKSSSDATKLEIWRNGRPDCSVDTGSIIKSGGSPVGNHIYFQVAFYSNSTQTEWYFEIDINGAYSNHYYYSEQPYKSSEYIFSIGERIIGSVDEIRFWNGISSRISPAPTSSDYESLTFTCDTKRVVDDGLSSIWRYENYGTDALLINATSAGQVTGLPATQSKTGSAYYQPTRSIKTFDVPSVYDVWVKFDVYSTTTGRWRLYEESPVSGITGACSKAYTSGYDYTDVQIFINNGNNASKAVSARMFKNTLMTYVIHMVSDATNGSVTVYFDGGLTSMTYTGNVNNGNPFENLNLQGDTVNNTPILFSNVVISNGNLWFDDNASVTTPQTIDFDLERVIAKSVSIDFDAERVLTSGTAVTLGVDLERVTVRSITETFDAERILVSGVAVTLDADLERVTVKSVTEVFDMERNLDNVVTESFDFERVLTAPVGVYFDIERNLVYVLHQNYDLERVLRKSTTEIFDLMRCIPYKFAADSANMQSVTIGIAEQQLTDNISIVHEGGLAYSQGTLVQSSMYCHVMDSVTVYFFDYLNHVSIEETSAKGVLQTIKCCSDIDSILYQQMAYEIPANEYYWSDDYVNFVQQYYGSHASALLARYNIHSADDLKKVPTAKASSHITKIASSLGKGVSLHFDDFISTMSTKVQSGTNYAGLIEELFGWTSRLPHMMINCYIRGNTLYAVQRGHEQNTVNLDNLQFTVFTERRKIVRTTWGSDPWSKTEVVSKAYNPWAEFGMLPFDDNSNSSPTYNDDGLVETTTVTHGDETVTTTYIYSTLKDGQKYLSQEIATTYVNGLKTDEVVTTHDPVTNTQQHVYATDDDGVLGGTVSSSNNDDRVTPFQARNYNNSDGVLMSDINGDIYLVKSISYHTDEIDKIERTVNGISLIDTSFPVDGSDKLKALTNAIKWLDRRTEVSITLDVYNYPHVIDFNDRLSFGGSTYYLRSNTLTVSEHIVNKQTIEIVRWQ